ARLNLEDASTLFSESHPAEMRTANGILEYRPYSGVEIYGRRNNPAEDRSIGKIVAAEERRIPRGVARTVRFVVSLGEAPPRIARYRLPAWYYASCGHLWPDGVFPAKGRTQPMLERGGRWLCENMLCGCFEDGSVGRGDRWRNGKIAESGWEGETPFALLWYYYLTGEAEALQAALRDAYNVADIATDHTDMAVRMHGHRLGARSLPMQRVLGLVAGYLETGDPYLLETAQAVMDHAYWWDRTNWPRRSVGRDAAYVRGLLALADVTDGEHYIERAREALRRFSERQLDSGAFTDQGGTTGFHGNVNVIVKPWMNLILCEAMLDFLERTEDPVIEKTLLKVVDWLISVAITNEKGEVYWGYKYRHGDNEALPWAPEYRLPLVRHGRPYPYVMRPLLYAARRTGQSKYLDVCLRNLDMEDSGERHGFDQLANKSVEQSAWFESHLWAARWDDDKLLVNPAPLPDGALIEGKIQTSAGDIGLRARREAGRLQVTLTEPQSFDVTVSYDGRSGTIPAGEDTCEFVVSED
ncbi:MAG: DUF982 domain-containing protein, partial [Planctomycetes bacterium]|nr:DUF982 domain-containing protein [Planctomycetota bacterium]